MDKDEPETGLSFERVVFFSDAVFAIVITLLVLELKVPHITEHTDSALRHALVELLPRVMGFVVSFLIIGLMWSEHHRIQRHGEGAPRNSPFEFRSNTLLQKPARHRVAPIAFALIPVFARVLDPTTKKARDYTDAVEESA